MRTVVAIRGWSVRLWLARRYGRLLRWLLGGSRPALFGLAAATLGTLLLGDARILGVYFILLLLWGASRARSRIVLEQFADHSTDDGQAARGVATLLATELARLRDLYRTVDQRRAIPTAVSAGRPIDATVKVEDLGDVLRETVSAESRLKIGQVEIPLGIVMAMVGRLVQGPRLSGAIHQHGDSAVLTATVTGRGRDYSWVVSRPVDALETTSARHQAQELVPELAYRIFTDLALSRSVKWRATAHFVESLRAIRACLGTPQNRALSLKLAERKLLEALAADDGFELVYYNLGVVYTELCNAAEDAGRLADAVNHRGAAKVAFQRATERDPSRWEAYYALALTSWEGGSDAYDENYLDAVIRPCERVAEIDPGAADVAKAYDLKGLAERRAGELSAASGSSRTACRLALRALARAEGSPRPLRSARTPAERLASQAANYLVNFAVALADKNRPPPGTWRLRERVRLRRIRAILGLAHSLNEPTPTPRFELGRIAREWGRPKLAVREFEAATRLEPRRPQYWAELALARAQADDQSGAFNACVQAVSTLDLASRSPDDVAVRANVIEAFRMTGQVEAADRLQAMERFGSEAEGLIDPDEKAPAMTAGAERQVELYLDSGQAWEAGQLAMQIAAAHTEPEQVEKWLRKALVWLEAHPEEIRRHGVRATLAYTLARLGRAPAALEEAQRALGMDPLSSYERQALGATYRETGDFDRARDSFEDALLWSPYDAHLRARLGECHWLTAMETTEATRRRAALQRAAEAFEDALTLYGSDEFQDQVYARYQLGRVYTALHDSEQAAAHLRVVAAVPDMAPLALMLLGEAHLHAYNFSAAERAFEACAVQTEGLIENGGDPKAYLGAEVGEGWPLGLVAAWANWGLAASWTERDGDLVDARKRLKRAEEHAESLGSSVGASTITASCLTVRGMGLCKEARVDDGLAALARAAAMAPEAGNYIELACAYEQKAASSTCSDRTGMLENARRCCQHVLDTRPKERERARAEELLERLGPRTPVAVE